MSDKNSFGGGNINSNYTPLTDIEQECILKLIESEKLVVEIVEWGYVRAPKAKFGDLRLALEWQMTFNKPETPMPVYYFDLILKTVGGTVLAKQRQKTVYGGRPLMISTGYSLHLIWDIAITTIDPKIVKEIMPLARGLTSRWTDRDTKGVTLFGNTKMGSTLQNKLFQLRKGEEDNRRDSQEQIEKVMAMEKNQSWKKDNDVDRDKE